MILFGTYKHSEKKMLINIIESIEGMIDNSMAKHNFGNVS